MGAGESNPIRNMDKRTARREYKADFCRAIQHYRNVVCKDRPKDELTWTEGEIMVFVRKRPIFKHELDLDEFDVVTCVNGSMITIHDARMHTVRFIHLFRLILIVGFRDYLVLLLTPNEVTNGRTN